MPSPSESRPAASSSTRPLQLSSIPLQTSLAPGLIAGFASLQSEQTVYPSPSASRSSVKPLQSLSRPSQTSTDESPGTHVCAIPATQLSIVLEHTPSPQEVDRKSTRLNSSHRTIS